LGFSGLSLVSFSYANASLVHKLIYTKINFTGQGQQGQQGGFNPFNPFGFPTPYQSSNSPSSQNSNNPSTFSSNPFNTFQGLSWPYGNQGNQGTNPFFGNNQFNQNPFFNQYQNNYPASSPVQQTQPQETSGSYPTNNNNQGQQNYPFGFPFANPFFPQYQQQPTPQLPAETPQTVKNPNTPNRPNQFPTTQNQKVNNNQGSQQGMPMPNEGVINNVPKDSETINNAAQPVELEVEHSKQDTKHPSLITPALPAKTPETPENDDEHFENKLDLQARLGLPKQAEETIENNDENSILDSEEEVLIFN
jgi:hypothetical protein